MSKYNALDHEMVPEHTVLDEDEVEELTDRYEIRKTDLPKIGRLDAAIKETDGEPGDVVKVVRESPTADEAVAYRIIVDE
ncbi:MAG: DNA-directed RNA polymerase subunit H [Methanobacteriota archaeon]|jgi:DNA-directed RNA polymerase subunit H|uniref:DNA-directed RNA polymerase subunit Rpo5 n=1 Tax=Halorutilus salinus TaxID=2487751 RepID=A0A9Q4C2X6_9EURY|nr:DNA-directed RNA polymerase subunit H [Halorutilus salinus]MCX2818081.1 DNA-directed RNA polymerase subunit H [Halorutilus salinus]